MSTRIVVSPEIPGTHDLRAVSFDAFFRSDGDVVARSRSSDTVALVLAGVTIHVKRYRYSGRQAFRGMLRNTFLGPSRVRAEYRMIRRLREVLGNVAPPAAAFGEERTLGFLRRSFLATQTVVDAEPVGPDVSPTELGTFLRRLHDGGFSHGRLFARNLIATADDGFRLVDLDRARFTDGPVAGSRAAGDLAHLLVSVPGLDEAALLKAYGTPPAKALLEEARRQAADALTRRTSGPPHVSD